MNFSIELYALYRIIYIGIGFYSKSLTNKKIPILFGTIAFGVILFSINVITNESVPNLLSQEINSNSILLTEVTAATSPVSNSERAQSIVVRFSDGPLPSEVPFTTFSLFQPVNFREDSLLHSNIYRFGDKPMFLLSSLPSKDKIPLYKAIDKEYFARTGDPTISPFTVEIDILAGDGSLIQTWKYKKCQIIGYGTHLQNIINLMPFSGEDGSEFRDKIAAQCAGVRLNTP